WPAVDDRSIRRPLPRCAGRHHRIPRPLPPRRARLLDAAGRARARADPGARGRAPDRGGPLERRARRPHPAAAASWSSRVCDPRSDGGAARRLHRRGDPRLCRLRRDGDELERALVRRRGRARRARSKRRGDRVPANDPDDDGHRGAAGLRSGRGRGLVAGRLCTRRAGAVAWIGDALGRKRRSGGAEQMTSAERIEKRLSELYAIGAGTRRGYSPEEDAAHELAAGWVREAGLQTEPDKGGNLIGRRGSPRVWSGSHLDTVPDGGKFDGALGMVAAIEAADRLPEAKLAVVAFRAEETGPMG